LEDNEIIPQYTMSGSPAINGVAERHNRTLMEREVEVEMGEIMN
jgi:hypothetical protein